MLAIHKSIKLRPRLLDSCRRLLAARSEPQTEVRQNADEQSEYVDEAQYPKIKDLTFRARKQAEAVAWHDSIKNVRTVEEKLIKINMPRYWGYKVLNISDDELPYNCLPVIQHYTRTVLEIEGEKKRVPKEGLIEGEVQKEVDPLDHLVASSKSEVQNALEFVFECYRHKYPDETVLEPRKREKELTQLIVEEIHRVLMNTLMPEFPHLKDVEVDYNPRHEAFWFVGGVHPPKSLVKKKEGMEWQKPMANDPVNQKVQYKGTPYLALRHSEQLANWKQETEYEDLNLAKTLPRYDFDARTLGYRKGHAHGTNIPGYWPGNKSNFGLLSYQPRSNILPLPHVADHVKDALHAQAIQTSYAWLLAQANYFGFNTFSELTYPMNTQTIITNGRDWSFYEYQLNTLLLHGPHIDENPRVNFCRGSGEMQLYQEIDAKGKLVGFNENVLSHLLKFYTNAPVIKREKAKLTPYLHPEYKHIADYPDAEQRAFLERTFKHMCANRPRHLAQPEIYLWEKIYKIDHNTRQMEARRRFFELGINPWKRTMDQHQKEYIPKALRPEGPKSKKKWKPSFYP